MIPFLQARHYLPANRLKVNWVVLHSAEIGESFEGAEILMKRCAEKRVYANGKDIVSSWHYAVDANSVTQSVREEDIAFHAPGANAAGVGIELCGRARQTLSEWQDEYSTSAIKHAANLTAGICKRWGIPVQFVAADALLRGARGITTHAEVSKAWKKSTHTDPGMFFPVQQFLDLVAHYKRVLA
ncbi:MAG: N-acetylmuramoyl-L-alanine amidase [Opitutales bacterium]